MFALQINETCDNIDMIAWMYQNDSTVVIILGIMYQQLDWTVLSQRVVKWFGNVATIQSHIYADRR